MRKRVFWGGASLIIIVVSVVIIIAYKQMNKFTIPAINNIDSIRVSPASVGLNETEEFFFDLNKKEDLDMVNNILNWKKSGKIIGKTKYGHFYHSYKPTCLLIELKDGRQIKIESATDAIITDLGNERTVEGRDVPDQVTLYLNNENPTREVSPQLKSFINDGWKSYFNYTQK